MRELYGGRADTTATAVDQHPATRFEPAQQAHVEKCGEKRFRESTGCGVTQDWGNRHRASLVDSDLLRVATSREQRHDVVTDLETAGVTPDLGHCPRALEPEDA